MYYVSNMSECFAYRYAKIDPLHISIQYLLARFNVFLHISHLSEHLVTVWTCVLLLLEMNKSNMTTSDRPRRADLLTVATQPLVPVQLMYSAVDVQMHYLQANGILRVSATGRRHVLDTEN